MSEAQPLTTTVSIDRKVSDGQYGSYGMFVSVSGITEDTAPEEIEAVLESGKMGYGLMVKFLRQRIADAQV